MAYLDLLFDELLQRQPRTGFPVPLFHSIYDPAEMLSDSSKVSSFSWGGRPSDWRRSVVGDACQEAFSFLLNCVLSHLLFIKAIHDDGTHRSRHCNYYQALERNKRVSK